MSCWSEQNQTKFVFNPSLLLKPLLKRLWQIVLIRRHQSFSFFLEEIDGVKGTTQSSPDPEADRPTPRY